jgi:asparagine synthase (glutamine-hydrolysing)
MCGILFTDNPTISQQKFLAGLKLQQHRGPDAPGGYAYENNVHLGHNRLKILDLDDHGNQPLASSCGNYLIVYNGEIYNYKELAKEFNINLQTSCDTELLIELYIKKGSQMLSHLNGMFAFVILNRKTGEWFAARDRLGVKPLYFCKHGKSYTFSSEMASILELYGTPNIDEIGLRQYKKLRTFFNGRTIYSGIKMFPAGHFIENGKMHKYWELTVDQQEPPTDEELYELLTSAIDYRCLSDVPVGSYLSGGVDSTLIAGLAKKPDTWTVGFSDKNEFEWAKIASNAFGSSHTEVLVDYEQFIETAKWLIKTRGEPLSVPNEVLLYLMTKEVKKKNTVVLSGEGADELFFGYDRIFRWAINSKKFDLHKFGELYSYGGHEDDEIIEDALAPFMHHKTPIDIVASFFQVSHLHGLLRRLDNSTMLCSVEARVPFVDYRLVERMAGVSPDYRMRDGIVKEPLKRVFNSILPEDIILRKKVGFPVPLDKIFQNNEGTAMDDWLNFNLANI